MPKNNVMGRKIENNYNININNFYSDNMHFNQNVENNNINNNNQIEEEPNNFM